MDDGGSSPCSIIVFLVLLGIQAVLTGFRKATELMNEKEIIRRAEEEKDRNSILLNKIIVRATIYMNSMQMIQSLIGLVMGGYYLPRWSVSFRIWLSGTSLFSNGSEWFISMTALVIAAFCLMYILLVFGFLLPQKLAQKYPDAWAYRLIKPVHFLKTVLYPLTGIVAVSTNLILRLLGLRSVDEQSDVTEEEIISMVNEGHEQGVLEAGEVEMITNIFEFGDKEASNIMTHRNNIMAIDSQMPFKDALNFMLKESNSRYPVYEENLDHIVGVLYLKDAMRIHTSDEGLNLPVGSIDGLVREAVFVPETKY